MVRALEHSHPLVALWMLACSAPASAVQTYVHHVYQERNGLPSGVVFDLAQEPSGRMWFATRGGLVSFDGIEWRVELTRKDLRPPVSRLEVDERGRVWGTAAGTWAQPVVRTEDQTWVDLPTAPGSPDRPEHLVAGIACPPAKRAADWRGAELLVCTRTRLLAYGTGGWSEAPLPAGVAQVNDFEFVDGRALLATEDGLFTNDGSGWELGWAGTDGQGSVWGVAPGANRDEPVWLIGPRWLGILRDGELELLGEHDLDAVGGFVRDDLGGMPAVSDGDRGVWFAHNSQTFHFDRRSGRVGLYGVATGFPVNGANALLRDMDENLWIASQRGLIRVPSLRFAIFDHSTGLATAEVSSLLEHPRGRLLIGQPGAVGLIDLESERVTVLELPTTDERMAPAMDMTVGPDGVPWIAATTAGVLRLEGSGELVPWPPVPGRVPRRWLPQTIHCDPRGTLWIGTNSGLFQVVGDDLLEVVDAPVPLKVRRVTSLRDGRLAVCTLDSGVWLRSVEGWANLKSQASSGGHAGSSAFAAYQTSRGQILVGALDGLFVEQRGELQPMLMGESRIEEPVYSINEDADGRLWVGTQLGLVAWDHGEPVRYGIHEGLPGLETNRAANLLDSSGAMWFGTVKGAVRYSAADDRRGSRAPVVDALLTEVDGRTHPSYERLELAHQTNDPAFRFRAISFHDSPGLVYRSRLEGFDEDWVIGGPSLVGQVRYSNLPSGEYRFVVQARSGEGPWSQPRGTGTLRIRPALWMTPWFLAAAFAGALALALGMLGFLKGRRDAQALRLEVEQRRAELERSQRLEGLGLLAGGVAHDFNNLLTAIMAHCSLARLDAGGEVATHMLGIETAAERGAMLTRALLAYARRQPTSPRTVVVDQLIRELETMLRPLIRAEIDFRLLLGGEDLAVHLDPAQFEQLLMNLVVNASDAMPGGGQLEIETSRVELPAAVEVAHGDRLPAGAWVRLSVRDTGIGMSAHTRAHLFDPFFTTKPGGRGTGLGLATCHGIVKQNGGYIDFSSSTEPGPGRGTTFELYFPAATPPPPETTVGPERTTVCELLGSCVLLAEDDPLVRPMLAEALRQAGCHVLVTQSGEEALAAARQHPGEIDLLVSDVIMPGISGPELRDHLLDQHPEVLTVLISGYTADELEELDPRGPAVVLLEKPFTPEQLLLTCSRMLAQDLPPELARGRLDGPADASGA